MKKTFIIFITFLLTISWGCKKFLDKNPDSRTELNTADKVSKLLVSAYPNATFISFAETMSDNTGEKKKAGTDKREIVAAYKFEDYLVSGDDTPESYWGACYAAIAAANQTIQACNEAQNPEQYKSQKGEALICRAYAHFMLVNLFSKSYDEATASTDMGIPYVMDPEDVLVKQYTRGTVKSVYENIEKDLLEGMPLLDNRRYVVPKYHFTTTSANAFACRYYLFKKDYAKAIDYANKAFPNNDYTSNLRKIATFYPTLLADEWEKTYTKASEPANLLLANQYSYYAYSFDYASRKYGWTTSKRDSVLKIPKEIIAFGKESSVSWGYKVTGFGEEDPFIPKWWMFWAESFPGAGYGNGLTMFPLFTTEEMLFNRIESYVQLAQYSKAIDDLNTFLKERIRNYDPSIHTITFQKIKSYYNADDKTSMLNAVLDIKKMETVFEGTRWFDICRHKMTVVHKYTDPETKTVTNIINGPNSLSRVIQIPATATSGQYAIPKNPR